MTFAHAGLMIPRMAILGGQRGNSVKPHFAIHDPSYFVYLSFFFPLGERKRKLICTRESDQLMVSDQRCAGIPQPDPVTEQCNTNCELRCSHNQSSGYLASYSSGLTFLKQKPSVFYTSGIMPHPENQIVQ